MSTSFYVTMLLALGFGYALGAIPFGLILTRAAGLGDVRKIGSGNIGATNVLRTGNKKLAALTLLLDALKGTAAVLIAHKLGGHYAGFAIAAGLAAGLGAFLGHLFPVTLGFKGGKGVATYIGVLLGLAWPAALAFCGIWLAVAAITRYSSAAALVACLATPAVLAFMGHAPAAWLMAILTVLVFIRHHANIRRLVKGEESRIGAKS